MSGLCDKCGKEYFTSCHDCMHILTMLFITSRKALILLPANDENRECREALLSLADFYKDKVVALAVPKKEG